MNFNGVFNSIMEGKDDKYIFRELTYEFWIANELYKGHAKYIEFNYFRCVVWLFRMKKTTCIGIVSEICKVDRGLTKKQWEFGPHRSKLYYFEPTCISLVLMLLLTNSKHAKCIVRPTKCTQCHLEYSYTSMALNVYC